MTRHRRTDPACREHREPRTWWQRRLYDRARGRACPICYPTPPTAGPAGTAGDSGAYSPGLIRFAQPREGGEAYIPLTPEQHRAGLDRAVRTLHVTAARLGLIPECQPIQQSDQTYADRGDPHLTTTGYLLTCQTCASELLNNQPGRLVHVTDTEHQVQPDTDRRTRPADTPGPNTT